MQSLRFARIGAVAAAVLPPSVAGLAAWDVISRHPIAFLIVLLAYELVIAATGIAVKVFARLEQRWVDRAAEAIDGWTRRLFSRYERRYRRYLVAVHHDVDVKGLTTRGSFALSLDEVFVDLSLMHQTPHHASGDILSPDTQPAEASVESTRRSIWEMLERGDHPLVILGAPGSGKTTLLKHMTVALGRGGRAVRRHGAKTGALPVLLFLREHVARLSREPHATLPAITRDTLRTIDAPEPPEWLDRQLRAGRCVVLFDGLDEVAQPEDRRTVVDWVERQIAAYPRSRFLLTSRPYGYRSYPVNSADVAQVRPFTERQAKTFVDRWYHATHVRATGRADIGVREEAKRMADDLMTRLSTHHALHALAVNPLLLTMVAHVHYYRGALPGSRAGLYREICQVLLGRRQEAKGLDGGPLTPDQKELVLRVLAYKMMEQRVRDLTLHQASAAISTTLASIRRGITPEGFLVSMEQECGLLVERENGLYSFPHLTLQEFLAAAYISERGLGDSLALRVTDDWWRETTLLYVAQADATAIVEACLKAEAGSVYAMELAVDCAEEGRELDPALREDLERLLSIDSAVQDPQRLEVAARVTIARKMRRAAPIAEDTWFCQTPVTRAEFALFLASTRGLESARRYLDDSAAGSSPARGLRSADVIEFVGWCRQFDSSISLPSSTLMAAMPRPVFDPDGKCAWVLYGKVVRVAQFDAGGPPRLGIETTAGVPVLGRFGRPRPVPTLHHRVLSILDSAIPDLSTRDRNTAERLRQWLSPPQDLDTLLSAVQVHGIAARAVRHDGTHDALRTDVTAPGSGTDLAFVSAQANTVDVDDIWFGYRELETINWTGLIAIREDVADRFVETIQATASAAFDDAGNGGGLAGRSSARALLIDILHNLLVSAPASPQWLRRRGAWRLVSRRPRYVDSYSRVTYDLVMHHLRTLLYEMAKLEMRERGELEPSEVLHLVLTE